MLLSSALDVSCTVRGRAGSRRHMQLDFPAELTITERWRLPIDRFLRRPMMVLRTLRANGSHYPFAILDGENLVTHEVVAASHDVVDSDALDQPGWNWRRC